MKRLLGMFGTLAMLCGLASQPAGASHYQAYVVDGTALYAPGRTLTVHAVRPGDGSTLDQGGYAIISRREVLVDITLTCVLGMTEEQTPFAFLSGTAADGTPYYITIAESAFLDTIPDTVAISTTAAFNPCGAPDPGAEVIAGDYAYWSVPIPALI